MTDFSDDFGPLTPTLKQLSPLLDMPSDPFTVINAALVQTGNSPVDIANDGSDEWIAGWTAYSLYLPYCIEARDWNFQTTIRTGLTRIGNSNFPRFQDVYSLPTDCLHLMVAWRTDIAAELPPYLGFGMPDGAIRAPQVDYHLVGNAVHTSAPDGLSAKYIQVPGSNGPTNATAMFNLALITFVAGSLFASLNEEYGISEKTLEMAEQRLELAASRSDQQEPRRSAFRSRMQERRRRRGTWGGTIG